MAVTETSGFLKYKDADGNVQILVPNLLKSSTEGSDKIFIVKVDDSGRLFAEEYTDESAV